MGVLPCLRPLMVASSVTVRSESGFSAREKDRPARFLEWTYLEEQEEERINPF